MSTAILLAEPSRNDIDPNGVEIPASAYTFKGFRRWAKSKDFPTRGRFSYLGGCLYIDITMEELETHNKVKTRIGSVLDLLSARLRLGEYYTDRALVTNREVQLSTEPDGTFVSFDSLRSGRVQIRGSADEPRGHLEIVGSPDWVLEVVSKHSVAKDLRMLPKLYHRAGVQEYWLVDARGKEIDFRVLVHGAKGYKPAAKRRGWQFSPVFQRWFRLTRQRNPVGSWDYELAIKE